MKEDRRRWLRILWSNETAVAFLGSFVWGWLLLVPALGIIAYGIVSLLGVDAVWALWLAGCLALFLGYCVGFLSGNESRGEAERDSYRKESEFGDAYRRDIYDLQSQAEKQRELMSKEILQLSVQLEAATRECTICAEPSAFIYKGDHSSVVCGVCGECDRLIQAGQRMKLIPRAARSRLRAGLMGIDPADPTLRRIERDPRHFSDQFYDRIAEDQSLTPKSWRDGCGDFP